LDVSLLIASSHHVNAMTEQREMDAYPIIDTRQDDSDWEQAGDVVALALLRLALQMLERKSRPSGEGLFYAAVNDR